MLDKENGDESMLKELMEQLRLNDEVIKVQINDQRLMKLAEYDATHGYIKTDVKKESFQGKFAELKVLVMNGEFTLRDLETDVYSRWGILEESRESTVSKKRQIGFCMTDIEVADIPEDSPENR